MEEKTILINSEMLDSVAGVCKLGKELKMMRERKALSQEKVATFVGTSIKTLQRWEADKHPITLYALVKYAELFGVKFLIDSD